MKLRIALLVPLVLASIPVLAADPAPVVKPVAKAEVVKPATPTAQNSPKSDGRSAAGPVKVGSQQDRMRECNKSATGKKGAERKAFMKSCLTTHKAA